MNPTAPSSNHLLRIAAEAQLLGAPQAQTHPAEELLHELQVHQIELEMQNEELRRAHLDLDTERARYFDLYDLAPVGYITVSEHGLVVQANFTASTLLGLNRGALLKQAFSRFIVAEDADTFYLLRKKILINPAPQSCELRMIKVPDQQVWLHLNVTCARDEAGPPELRIALSDISERKQVEAELIESEALSLAILNSVTPEIAVLDRNGVILAANETWRRFSMENSLVPGHPAAYTEVGANYLSVCASSTGVGSDEALNTRQGVLAVLDGSLPVFTLEYPCHSPQEQRWFSMSVTPLGPNRRGVVISHTNVTQIHLQEELRLHNEALHRKALVREVHHRIKNNLQGITGLLSQFAKIYPETAEPITQAISQVQGISVIHGLQGCSNTSSVRLSELTQAIARDAEILWQTPFTVKIPEEWRDHLVAEKEAVPIALILNELLLNAVKHGGKAHGHVRVTLQDANRESVHICITNAGRLQIDSPPLDVIHSGLKLITALMPPNGAHINREQLGDEVVTVLTLAPPVIFLET